MPSGAKKRKALKKKKEQEAFGGHGTINKVSNDHGYDEQGSQDEGESDGSLCSLGSQGNGEVWARDLPPSPLSGLGKDTVKATTEDAEVAQGHGAKGEDVLVLGRGTDHEENGVEKQPISSHENATHKATKATSQEAGGTLEIAPADDSVKPVGSSVSKVMISDKNKQVESSTDADSVQQKSDESEEKRRLEEAKEGNIPGSAAETSKEVKSVKESEVPECSEAKSLLPSGPPVVRTSWLSCCGLFDVMAGSER